jgi:antitoxin (DNA-binding transcriptional repressor) of toxin-antitoxin stability system
MTVMSIREFNANVSKAISRVQAGETIEISKGGEIVAEVRPRPKLVGEARKAALAKLDELLSRKFGPYTGPITQEDKYGDDPL